MKTGAVGIDCHSFVLESITPLGSGWAYKDGSAFGGLVAGQLLANGFHTGSALLADFGLSLFKKPFHGLCSGSVVVG